MACDSLSIPSVQQTSRPMPFTWRTISNTDENAFRSLFSPTSLQAAPMQKRVLPASLARRAISTTSITFIVGVGFTNVLWAALWLQYLQSSTQPPVLIDSSVHCCTSRGLKCCLWTLAALFTRSKNGMSYISWISCLDQSCRMVAAFVEKTLFNRLIVRGMSCLVEVFMRCAWWSYNYVDTTINCRKQYFSCVL